MRCSPIGPTNARIVIIGEAPGAHEEEKGEPFVGSAGYELATQLRDAGIIGGENNDLLRNMRSVCFLTNVCHDRPPNNKIENWIGVPLKLRDKTEVKFRGKIVKPHIPAEVERLRREILAVNPSIIITCGNTPLWALTDKFGIAKWRGSQLETDFTDGNVPYRLIPIYHPAAVLRQYEWRYITVSDLKRAKRESFQQRYKKPKYHYVVGAGFEETKDTLRFLTSMADRGETPLVSDVEIKRKEILCTGIGWSETNAICIPFYGPSGHYWTIEQHIEIVSLIQRLFLHPNVRLANQNISFDIQYFFWKQFFWPKAHFDTMIAQGVLFSGLPRSLDFLASMYNKHYIYWKDDGKFWKDDAAVNYNNLWNYNCLDCVATYEVMLHQQKALNALKLREQFNFIMYRVFPKVMRMMLRGVRVSLEAKARLHRELELFLSSLDSEIKMMVGWPINTDSPKQMQDLFYQRLRLPIQKKKGIRNGQTVMVPTCDDDALKKLAMIEPLIRPLVSHINSLRSYGTVFEATTKRVDPDGRWRTSYDLVKSTYRFSSSENPFGSGLNLQNLTSGKDIT